MIEVVEVIKDNGNIASVVIDHALCVVKHGPGIPINTCFNYHNYKDNIDLLKEKMKKLGE